jgi:hypothetical protein
MFRIVAALTVLIGSAACLLADDWPDIRTVAPDLVVPQMVDEDPAAERRVRSKTPNWPGTVYHSLYLPPDWHADKKYPVIVELPGNGGYRDALGDECSGRPEGCSLGYGVSGGEKFIWVCLPFLDDAGNDLAIQWWGDKPAYRSEATLKYWQSTVRHVCDQWSGDPDRVILCGFSRGAIACNALGLHDEETAKLWRAFIVCSHYDGVRSWPFPDSDKASALQRLQRLNDRPQFICGERDQVESTRKYLNTAFAEDSKLTPFTIAPTGFRNHNDQWTLRPSETRTQLREWLSRVIRD